jgi:hypothetical protein
MIFEDILQTKLALSTKNTANLSEKCEKSPKLLFVTLSPDAMQTNSGVCLFSQ